MWYTPSDPVSCSSKDGAGDGDFSCTGDESDSDMSMSLSGSEDDMEDEKVFVTIVLSAISECERSRKEGETGIHCFLDTGATTYISSVLSDFTGDLKLGRYVNVYGIGTEPRRGRRLPLKRNNFDIKDGIFLDVINSKCKRLCPVPKAHTLENYEPGVSGWIERREDGFVFPVNTSQIPPTVCLELLDDEICCPAYTKHLAVSTDSLLSDSEDEGMFDDIGSSCDSNYSTEEYDLQHDTSKSTKPTLKLNDTSNLQNKTTIPFELGDPSSKPSSKNPPNPKPPTKRKKVPKNLLHKRLCHMTDMRRAKCRCLACELSKKVRKRFSKKRSDKYVQKKSLAQLDSDFLGPVTPESLRKYRYLMLVVCPKSKMFWCIPIRHKSENTAKLKELVADVRSRYGRTLVDPVIYYWRTDNEPVWDGAFIKELEKKQIYALRPSPYCPAANGVVERFVRKIIQGLRSMLMYVDGRLWCFAAEHYAMVYNDCFVSSKGGTKAPREIVDEDLLEVGDPRKRHVDIPGSNPQSNLLKSKIKRDHLVASKYCTFGSLAVVYLENPVRAQADKYSGIPTGKFSLKWIPGVYLGKDPKSSNPLIGVWTRGTFKVRRERHAYREVGCKT